MQYTSDCKAINPKENEQLVKEFVPLKCGAISKSRQNVGRVEDKVDLHAKDANGRRLLSIFRDLPMIKLD